MKVLVCGLILGAAQSAAAQSKWEDRAYINVGFGVESGNSDLNDTKSFSIYEETGTVIANSSFSSGSLFDVGVGLRVWRNLSVGASYHQEMNTAEGILQGTIPHPLFFNSPRIFTGSVPGLERKENATHLQFGWTVPINAAMDVSVFGGPSFFRLQQEVVADVTVGEKGAPFSEVVIQPKIETRKKSAVGYNVGADFSYMLWQNDSVRLGGGLFVRYAAASTSVLLLSTDQATDVGGIQFGFGGRIRF